MSINFPTSLDSLTNPAPTDLRSTVSLSGKVSDLNDAVEALEAKVGIDGSVDTDSLDYKVSQKQAACEVKDTPFTAINGGRYNCVATLTITDPSPVEGQGFEVFARNGTITVGGTDYTVPGTKICRMFHSGSWSNFVKYPVTGGEGSSAQVLTSNGAGVAPSFQSAPSGSTDLSYTAATRVIASSTGTDATLPLVTTGDAGLAPASGGGTSNFLRADGTWTAPSSGAPKEIRIRIPGQLVADANNHQGLWWYNNTGGSITLSNVSFSLSSTPGTSASFNIYKSSGTSSNGIDASAVNLFTSAVTISTGSYVSATNVPDTTTVESGRFVSLRVTALSGTAPIDLEAIISYA